MPEVCMAPKKGRPKKTENVAMRTVAFRCTVEWVKWLEEAAKHDRTAVATFLDRAAAEHAKSIGFPKAPPERLP